MMSFKNWKPDVVVGVDFGMTSTGVAYSAAPEWARPEIIQHWPGTSGTGLADKVDTALAYDHITGSLVTWGFTVDPYNDQFRIEENFKLFLDPEYRDTFPGAPSLAQARQWYMEYLSCVYRQITRHFSDTIPRWNGRLVEFVFSVPTTWKDPAMIAEIEKLIKTAGFGSKESHRVSITLTEAEAAAVTVAKSQYDKGDVFIVCDAGGGTTDVNILKVASSDPGKTKLEPLSYVEGQAIGSTLIDFNIEKVLRSRLELVRQYLGAEPDILAHKMMKQGRFESFKRGYGEEASSLDVPLQIPTMAPGQDFPHAQITDSKIYITQQDLQYVFDEQIERIYHLIDEELRKLHANSPLESVSYLVLSGGLGSSPYVRKKLQMRYEMGGEHVNAEKMTILKTLKPQLAVVQGLVMDRVQNLEPDNVVYTKRRCRTSYGIVVRELYNPNKHLNEDVVQDPRDGKRWAERQIRWFIRQGEAVDVKEGVKYPFKRKLDLGYQRSPWTVQVVMSNLPNKLLPQSLKREGARTVCAVESYVKEQDMKLKNRHWYNTKPKYYRADFNVRVLILPAGLKFETVSKDGVTVSTNHEEIQVQWMPSTKKDITHDVVDTAYGLESPAEDTKPW